LFSAELALEHQITAHQPGDLTADGQAQAGPITRPGLGASAARN
jgi:hypothetical protein